MKIKDITEKTEPLYYCCLEDWSEEMKEAGDHKKLWYECMKDKGVRVKFAVDEHDVIGGMIQYLPIEQSQFKGENLYVILCIWVHGYKQGRGNFRKKGMGKALMEAAEEDCRKIGTNGLVAWGLGIPVWMKASWFKRQGYKVIDKKGIVRLLWKPFNEQAVKPSIIHPKKKPGKGTGKVNVTMFRQGWCPAMNISHERTLRAAMEFDDKIDLRVYETTDREVIDEWGIPEGIFIDGRELPTGPPRSYDKIRIRIKKRADRLPG